MKKKQPADTKEYWIVISISAFLVGLSYHFSIEIYPFIIGGLLGTIIYYAQQGAMK